MLSDRLILKKNCKLKQHLEAVGQTLMIHSHKNFLQSWIYGTEF